MQLCREDSSKTMHCYLWFLCKGRNKGQENNPESDQSPPDVCQLFWAWGGIFTGEVLSQHHLSVFRHLVDAKQEAGETLKLCSLEFSPGMEEYSHSVCYEMLDAYRSRAWGRAAEMASILCDIRNRWKMQRLMHQCWKPRHRDCFCF